MNQINTHLLWHALLFRLVRTQKRLFVFAIVTVSLGVALALGIRLGTESATRSLEETLPLQGDSSWSAPVSAQGAEALQFLRSVAFRSPARIFSIIEAQALQGTGWSERTVSLQIIYPWSGEPYAQMKQDVCTETFSSLTQIRIGGKNFKIRLHSAGQYQDSAQRCRAATIDTQSLAENPDLQAVLSSELSKAPVRAMFRLKTKEEKEYFDSLKTLALKVSGFEFSIEQQRIERLKDVTRSFRTNLQLMGFIALFIGFAMVHHIFSLLITRQTQTLAALSAMGISLRKQAKILLVLACFLGLAASTVGTLLGLLAGAFLSWVTSATVKNLYDSLVDASRFYWHPIDLLYGFSLGFAACILGALHPIFKVRNLPVAQIMRDGSFESHQTGLTLRQAVGLGIVLALLSLVSLQYTWVWNRIPITALAACLGFLIVSALVAQVISNLLYGAGRLKQNSENWQKNLRLYMPPQTAVVVQVLTLTFTLTFGVKGMAESFRRTVAEWSESSLKADLWIRTVGAAGARLPDEVLNRLAQARGKEAIAIDSLTILPARLSMTTKQNTKPVLYANAHMSDQARVAPMRILLPEGTDKPRQSKLAQDIADTATSCAGTKESPCLAYISEPVQVHFDLQMPIGKVLCPEIQNLQICFKISAVYQDFGSDQGVILSDRGVYERLSGQRVQPTFANVYLAKKSEDQPTQLETDLRNIVQTSDGTLGFETLEELQQRILETFDNTFRVTDALYILCGIIAVIATVSSLNMQILLRRREWNIQWALGIGAQELNRRFSVWSAMMAVLAAGVSILGGIVLSAVLVYAVNYYSFGYSLSLSIPWHLPVVLLVVATLSGYLSGRIQSRALTDALSPNSIAQE